MATSLYLSSDEVFDHSCGPCKKGDKIEKNATFYCHECEETLCTECQSCHQKLPITSGHKVSTIDELMKSSEARCDQKMSDELQQLDIGRSSRLRRDQLPTPAKPFTKATLSSQFNSYLADDTDPAYICSLLFSGDLIYIAYGDNDKVKIFDKQGQHSSTIQINQPKHITEIDENRIAVTNFTKNIRLYTRTGSSFHKTASIHTDMKTLRTCFDNDLLYAICCEICKAHQIQVLTLDGRIKRRIEPLSQGSLVLQNPGYIAVNQQTGTIYVTDWEKGLIALTPTGEVKFVDQLFSCTTTAECVAVDDQGDVYVCGLNTHNIMKISADGQNKAELLGKDEHLYRVQNVAIQGNIMVVCCMENSIVRIYTLS